MPYEDSIGMYYPASWINGFLFAVECKEIIGYFARYKKEAPAYRVGVLVALLADLICVVSIMILSWLYAESWPWCVPAYCMTTSISTLACHLILLGRIKTLSRNWIASACILPVVLAAFVIGAVTTQALAVYNPDQQWLSYIWAGVRAGADILIAVAIVVYQQTDKTTIPLAQSPIKRYTLMFVSTGAVSCVMSVVTLVLLVAKPKGHVGTLFSMVIGRVYTLTLVLNLTIRLENREQLVEETADRTENYNLKNRTGGAGGGGIRVDRSVVVQADREEHNFAVQPAVLYSNSNQTYQNDNNTSDDLSWDGDRKQESQVDLVK